MCTRLLLDPDADPGSDPGPGPGHRISPKGRADLQIGVSGAKLHKKAEFDVLRCLAPQNPSKKSKKHYLRDHFVFSI